MPNTSCSRELCHEGKQLHLWQQGDVQVSFPSHRCRSTEANVGYFVQIKVQYCCLLLLSCKKGYLPQIPYEFQCLSTLRWSGTPPVCYPVTCGGPPRVEHADYTFNTNTYLSTVNYTCVEGYRYGILGQFYLPGALRTP